MLTWLVCIETHVKMKTECDLEMTCDIQCELAFTPN